MASVAVSDMSWRSLFEPALEPAATVIAMSSSACAKAAGVPYVFPCRRSGILYTTCTTADWDWPWCCAETNRYGNFIISSSECGDCNDNCETEPGPIAPNAKPLQYRNGVRRFLRWL